MSRAIFLILFLASGILIFLTGCKSTVGKKSADQPSGVLAFLTTRDGNFEIYSMNTDGTNPINLSNNKAVDFWSSWSPDGQQILFYTNRDGNNEIYRMDADGKNPVNISNHPSHDYLPEWSPDGKKIVFTSERDHEEREIYTMNADGSRVVRLTSNELYEEVPTWSIDGNKILFTRQIIEMKDTTRTSNGEIFIMDADGKNEKRLTNKKGFDSGAKFSPDGKRIAFYGPNEVKNSEIFVMNADGSSIINLTQDALEDYSPSWSPDGKWIAYTSGTSTQYDVWIIHVTSKQKIRLTKEPKRNETPVWQPNFNQPNR
jgi:TolB protein